MTKRTEIIVSTVFGMMGMALGAIIARQNLQKQLERYDEQVNKFKKYFDVTNKWIHLKNEGVILADYFKKNGWMHIAIYGMGKLGNRLLEELKDSEVVVDYGIDRNTDCVCSDIEIREISAELPTVDVIVVTPFLEYDEIEEELMNLTDYHVVSVEDIIWNCR